MSAAQTPQEPKPSYRLRKRARMRQRTSFHLVTAKGDVFPGREVVVRRVRNDVGIPRIGCAVPQGYGSAVRRNRFRRLVREAFRHRQDRLGPFDFLVSPKRSLKRPTMAGIGYDLDRTLTKKPAPPRKKRR